MEFSSILFLIAVFCYCGSAVLYLWNLRCGCVTRHRAAHMVMGAGLVVHGVGIIARSVEQGRAPFTNVYESFILVAWALAAIYLFMERNRRLMAMGAFVSLLALAATLWSALSLESISAYSHPALNSSWKAIHVTSTLLSYAGFGLAFAAAVGYIVQEHMLKAKKIGIVQRYLPPLDVMDNLAYRMVSLSFPMLTLGIITGAMWAQSAWGRYWGWDPKEVWSAITWLVYAAYLHVRIVQGWRGKWANRLLIAGFLCVLITWLGVTFLMPGKHSTFGN